MSITEIKKETVLRTTAMFGEGERLAVQTGTRTHLVVTRAVIEDIVGGGRTIDLYGYRQERPAVYAGWQYPGNEPRHARVSLDGPVVAGIRHIVAMMEGAE